MEIRAIFRELLGRVEHIELAGVPTWIRANFVQGPEEHPDQLPDALNRGPMPRDIRELRDDPEAYAAELRRRWGGLLSYRYIGRTWSQMDLGPADNTVTLRRDMRSPSGAILLAVLGIAAPEGGGMSDLEAVPNPVIHSCQVLDPGRDVQRIRGASPKSSSRVDRWATAARALSTRTARAACLRSRRARGSASARRPPGSRRCRSSRSSLRTVRTCRRCGRSSGQRVAPTVIGCCRCCRRRSPRPMRRCISDPSSSFSRQPRSTWRSRPPGPIGCRRSRRT